MNSIPAIVMAMDVGCRRDEPGGLRADRPHGAPRPTHGEAYVCIISNGRIGVKLCRCMDERYINPVGIDVALRTYRINKAVVVRISKRAPMTVDSLAPYDDEHRRWRS